MKIIAFAAVSLMLVGCNQPVDESEVVVSTEDDSVAACVRRGVAYFKEIGSYPTLSSAPNRGRNADDVAIERCNRTTTAF